MATMTAAALRAVLTGAGATDATIELALRLTAPARHEARVQSAMRAALEYAAVGAGDSPEPGAVEAMLEAVQDGESGADLPRPNDLLSGDCWALAASAHCAAEAWVGRGGPYGAGGPGRSTDRAPWARVLGKGRAQASDGSAWDAALDDASVRLARAAGAPDGFVTLEPTSEGLRACMPGASVRLDFTPERAYALCVRGLAGALPAEAHHQLGRLDIGCDFRSCNLRFGGTLEQWAETLDHIGLAGAVEYLADVPDTVPSGYRVQDYVPGIFMPWVERAIAAREERRNR
jgi:hypothetical protein